MKRNKVKTKVIVVNLVAKHSYTFNKSKVERDRTKYVRNEKHKLSLA